MLSAIGTVIPQNKPYSFYVENYPDEGEKVLGFVTHKLIWALQWDHIYSADYFYLLLFFWAASLAACTSTNQWPAVKVAQRWRFRKSTESIAGLECAEILPNARLEDLGKALASKNYQAGSVTQQRCVQWAANASAIGVLDNDDIWNHHIMERHACITRP